MALHTLRRMASGGIYDQIGGGFSRYTVDARWIVPHFEKMLYDNALLARAYLHAFQVTGEPLFRRVCEETLDWAMRELRQDEGGFASALDADSEGVEGKFYVWTPAQIRGGARRRARRGGDPRTSASPTAGNFEGATSILVRATSDPPRLAEIKARLLAARGAARAAGARRQAADELERADDLRARRRRRGAGARRLRARGGRGRATFVQRELRDATAGCCARSTAARRSSTPTSRTTRTCSRRYLTLYEATFDARWFARARELAEHDPRALRRPRARRLLLGRRRPRGADRAPQGPRGRADPVRRVGRRVRAAAARAAHRRGALRGRGAVARAAAAQVAPEHPLAFAHLLQAIDFSLAPVREVALVGRRSRAARAGRTRRLPPARRAGRRDRGGVPLLEGREPVDGRAAAYVCERFTCKLPVTTPDGARGAADLTRRLVPAVQQVNDTCRRFRRHGPPLHDPRRSHGEVGRLLRDAPPLRRLREPIGQVRGRAEERDVVVPAGQRGVGQGARRRQALPGRRARAGGDRLRAPGRADGGRQAAHRGDRRQAQREPPAAGGRRAAAGVLAQRQGRDHRPAGRSPATARATSSSDAVQSIRDRAGEPAGGLDVKLTGAAGYSLDAIKVFGNINGSLLLVAALIVLILLIVIYRSPIFWIDPVLHRAAGRGRGARLRLPAGRGGRDHQRPVRRHPAGARVRRGHGLRAAARLALPRGAAPPRGQARGDGDRAAQRRPRDPRVRPDGDRRAADAQRRRGQRHGRPRADRRDGRRAGDDLDADAAAGVARRSRPRWWFWPRTPHVGEIGTSTRRTASGGGSATASRCAHAPCG